MRACRCCSLELVLKTWYGAMALCCAPVVSDACEPLRGFAIFVVPARSALGARWHRARGRRAESQSRSRTIPRTYIREPTDPLGTSARVSNIGFAATRGPHGPVHAARPAVSSYAARPRSTRARARPTSDRARLCRPAGGPPSKRTLEPWLSSCRAVEAPSRRCRGTVEVLSRPCLSSLSSSCQVPVESLSSLSSLTPCAWASRSVEVCQGLSRSVEVCRVAVELSSCQAVSRAVKLCIQYNI